MIQRIQSIYLLTIFLLGLLAVVFNPSYAAFKDNRGNRTISLGYTETSLINGTGKLNKPNYINYMVLLGITIGAGAAIFLYKNTPLQKKICIYLSFLSVLFILIMYLDYISASRQFPDNDGYPGLLSVFPLIFIVCSILAWARIRSDENLIKSMDRIR